jgi:hypothetical protein
MPLHQIKTEEILPSLNAETVLASSTNEGKQLLMVTKADILSVIENTSWNSVKVKFRVAQKGYIKPGQTKFVDPEYSEVIHEDNEGNVRHYWDFNFLENAVNHYNSIS